MKNGIRASLDFDRLFGTFCIALAALFGYGTYTMEESLAFQQIGPRLWPTILSISLLLIGAAIIFERKEEPDASEQTEIADELSHGSGPAWILFGAILLSAPVLMLFGFWPAGTFLMAVIFFLKDTRDHILRSALCAVIVPGVVYYVFTRFFEQFLPIGSLFQ